MKDEDCIQQEIVEWYRNHYCLKHHSPRGMIFAVPNQKQQHLVRIGVLRGVCDLMVLLPTGEWIFVEAKTSTGRVYKDQEDFANRIGRHGHQYLVVRSMEEFKQLIEDFLNTSSVKVGLIKNKVT